MVRRSFRLGLRLGLLIGIGFALFKTIQARRPAPLDASGGGDWEPLRSDAGAPGAGRPEPATARPRPEPAPVPESLRMPEVPDPVVPPSAASEGRAATSTPPLPPSDLPVDEVGEPIELPAAPPADETGADPRDIVAEPDPEPAPVEAPVKKTAARKKAAAPKPEPETPPTTSDDIVPATAAAKKATKKAAKKATKKATKKGAVPETAPPPAWVEAAEGTCPPTHPVKAKLASKLFHLPGMFAYDRTRPDRCYLDADTAVTDGFTQAKR